MWFRGAPFEELRRGNVTELLAYAFYYKTVRGCGWRGCVYGWGVGAVDAVIMGLLVVGWK